MKGVMEFEILENVAMLLLKISVPGEKEKLS